MVWVFEEFFYVYLWVVECMVGFFVGYVYCVDECGFGVYDVYFVFVVVVGCFDDDWIVDCVCNFDDFFWIVW